MPDSVIDASVVGLANGDLAARRPGNVFDRRVLAIERVVTGARRLRYNSKLLREYLSLVQRRRNDVIELLFELLDSPRSIRVPRNTLSRQHFATAIRTCRWPSHDQHLLAAALDGDHPLVVVTEARLAQCGRLVLRYFRVRIEHLA